MKRIASRHCLGLSLFALLSIGCCAAAQAQLKESGFVSSSSNELFKPHVSTVAAPDVVDSNTIKHRQVDSKVIQQIGRAREILPNWHGVNNIVPGHGHSGQ